MSVFDLESVFETLSLEIERCHYLSRRVELEQNANYLADELDLLAIYVETQFNLGEDEFAWCAPRMVRAIASPHATVLRQTDAAAFEAPHQTHAILGKSFLRALERRRPIRLDQIWPSSP